MAETTAEADGEAEEQEYDVKPYLSLQPTVRIVGTLDDLAFGGQMGADVEETGTTAILDMENVEVVNGNIYENDIKPDDGTTADAIDEDDPRPTDYRVVDPDDSSVNVKGEYLFTGEQYGEYTEVDDFADEELTLWINGMSGQRSLRELDFNGSPFASYTDRGSLVKGLLQVPEGWRDASSTRKKELVDDGKAPRVARPPILREEAENREIVIDLGRLNGSRGYELNLFWADEMEDDIGLDGDIDELRNESGWVDADYAIAPKFTDFDEADERIAEEGVSFTLYHGEGWEDEPENAETMASDFDVGGSSTDGDDDDAEVGADGFTENQRTFIDAVEGAMAGSGQTVAEFYEAEGGLGAVIERNTGNFDTTPKVDDVRAELYDRLSHLNSDDLE